MKRLFGVLALSLLAATFAPRPAAAVESWEVAAADVLTGVVPIGAFALTYYKDDSAGRRQWFWSTATSLVINTGLRVVFNDHDWGERPNGHPYGFPSGHMSFIVSGGSFLQERYGYRWGVPAHLMSAYVGYVRVETGHHRWRDIAAAAALAYGVSRVFVTPHDEEKVTVSALVGDGGELGVQLGYDF